MKDWEIRHDDEGRVEEALVENVAAVRLERVDSDHWRATCSLHDGTRLVFRLAAERLAPGTPAAERALAERLAEGGRAIVLGSETPPAARIVVSAELEPP